MCCESAINCVVNLIELKTKKRKNEPPFDYNRCFGIDPSSERFQKFGGQSWRSSKYV